MKNNKGVTLTELIVAISIVAILAVALGFQYQGWMGKYRLESQVKQMYVDFMNARTRAMARSRMHFLTWTANSYSIYEDTSPAPDGDVTLQTGADTLLPSYPKAVQYAINWNGTGTQINFDRRGLLVLTDGSAATGAFYLTSSNINADYDCINISSTRVKMGKWNGTTNCNAQ